MRLLQRARRLFELARDARDGTERRSSRRCVSRLTFVALLSATDFSSTATAAKARAPPPNKKRKTDGSSRAGSPASSAAASPMPTFAGSPPNPSTPLPRPVAAAKAQPVLPSKSPAQHPLPIAPAPNPKKPTPKNRRDSLNAQLPLKPGRPIAVKESKKNLTTGQQPDNYILGRIVQQLQGDKNRCVTESSLSALSVS